MSAASHTFSAPEPPRGRFAPALHFLTTVEQKTVDQLMEIAEESHRRQHTVDRLCYDLTARALALGYTAAIAVQEVASRAMPSFPGEQVVAPILLLDLRPLRPRPATPR